METADLDQRISDADSAYGLARTTMFIVEVGHCDADQLGRVAAIVRQQQAFLAAIDADIHVRRTELGRGGNERAVGRKVDPKGQQSTRDKKAAEIRGKVLDALPGMDDATRSGELPADYADAIGKATATLTDAELAEFWRQNQEIADVASTMSLHQFKLHLQLRVTAVQRNDGMDLLARQRRNRKATTWTDVADGMGRLSAAFDPETAARVFAAIDEKVDAMYRTGRDNPQEHRSREQMMADAVAELILAGANGSGTGSGRTELLVLIDLQSLLTGLHDASVHETGNGVSLPVGEIRKLACDAGIIPVVLDGDSVPLDHGRTQRLASKEQRRALRSVHRTCAFDGCTVAFDRCEIHHSKPWQAPFNGDTDLARLAPVCQRHHHQIHDRNLKVTLDAATGTMTVEHPDGSIETHPPPGLAPPRRPPPPTTAA